MKGRESLCAALERSRALLDLIGDGDWTPQDRAHAALCEAVEQGTGAQPGGSDARLLRAIRAHRKRLPELYQASGLSEREEAAMQAALDAADEGTSQVPAVEFCEEPVTPRSDFGI